MSRKAFTILAFVVTAIVLVSPRSAVAVIDERLVYPGSNCVKVAGGAPTFNSNGWLVNNTSSLMIVQCPMYDNGTDFTGNVWVLDNSTTANVTCSSNARNPISGSGTQTLSTSGNSSSSKVLSFTGPDISGTFTFRFYTCTLPPTTAVINYRGIAQ
jgi:hypothetical protein